MNRIPESAVVVMLLLAAVPLADAQQATTLDRIRITGHGFIDAAPDLATLRTSISATAPTIEEARADVDSRYARAVETVTGAGVPEADIDGAGVRVQKEYEWSDNRRLYKGERMTRTLVIKVRDTSIYADVLSALVDSGITAIDQTTMGFSDENALRQTALGIAADNARGNAEFLAERLGRSLGKVVSITDQSGPPPGPYPPQPVMMRAAEAASDAPPVREMFGTRRVNATIIVEFELN